MSASMLTNYLLERMSSPHTTYYTGQASTVLRSSQNEVLLCQSATAIVLLLKTNK